MEENKEKRKILVTGSGGMLGTELCAALSDDYEIAGLDIVQKTEDRRQKTDFVKCDIADKKFTRKTIIELKPDIIIHAAAWTDVDGCERNAEKAKKINETGTENVAQAAGETGALLVYMSTDFIFDGNKKTPYVEDDLSAPLGVYAATKLAGEKIVKKLKKSIIIRTSWLYGKNGKSFVETILEKTKKETTLKVVDDQVGSPTYTKDLAVGIRKLLDIMLRRTPNHSPLCGLGTGQARDEGRGTKEIFHISNKGEVSRFDYAKEILKVAGLETVKVEPAKSAELHCVVKRPAYSVLDNTKFERLTQHKMRPWQDALKGYMDEKA